MVFAVDSLQPFAGNMRVDLGGGNVRVAQHQLDRSKVGSVGQQVGSERVPKHVRCDRLADARAPSVGTNDLPESLSCHPCAPAGDEEIVAQPFPKESCAISPQVFSHRLGSGRADRDYPLLAPFSHHPDQALPKMTYRYRVSSQLLDGSLSAPSNEVEVVRGP